MLTRFLLVGLIKPHVVRGARCTGGGVDFETKLLAKRNPNSAGQNLKCARCSVNVDVISKPKGLNVNGGSPL